MGKRLLAAAVTTVLLVGLGYVIWERIGVPDSRTASPTPVVADAPDVLVEEVDATVERRIGGTGEWSEIKPGDALSPDDEIRTSGTGAATFRVGELARVHVASSSQVKVSDVTKTVSKVLLQAGRVSASVSGGTTSQRFQVGVEGSDAIAEAHEGKFSVLTDGEGQVSVATDEGSARLSASGKSVDISAGQYSVAEPNIAPSAPRAIPASLFVKIGRPPKRLAKKSTVLRGETSPGAIVSVNGVSVASGNDGKFRTTVALREGKNNIVVEVLDATGRRQTERIDGVHVDTRAPDVDSTVDWGTPKPEGKQ